MTAAAAFDLSPYIHITRGTLDASVDMQLDEIERGFIDQLETRS
jgi:hypothetical protein